MIVSLNDKEKYNHMFQMKKLFCDVLCMVLICLMVWVSNCSFHLKVFWICFEWVQCTSINSLGSMFVIFNEKKSHFSICMMNVIFCMRCIVKRSKDKPDNIGFYLYMYNHQNIFSLYPRMHVIYNLYGV